MLIIHQQKEIVNLFIFISFHLSMTLQPVVRPRTLLQFRNRFHRVGRTPWTGDEPVTYTQDNTNTE
jgi:hypothetical protein